MGGDTAGFVDGQHIWERGGTGHTDYMGNDGPGTSADFQWQLDDLRDQIAALRAQMRGLHDAGKFAQRRADAIEARADASEARADASQLRADRAEVRMDDNHRRLDALETGAGLDREMIAQLHADETGAFAVLSRESQNTNRKLSAIAEDLVRTRDVSHLLHA